MREEEGRVSADRYVQHRDEKQAVWYCVAQPPTWGGQGGGKGGGRDVCQHTCNQGREEG